MIEREKEAVNYKAHTLQHFRDLWATKLTLKNFSRAFKYKLWMSIHLAIWLITQYMLDINTYTMKKSTEAKGYKW